MDEGTYAKNLLAQKLSRKSYLSHELFEWLVKKGVKEEVAKKAIELFSDAGYIDDEAWVVSEARRFSLMGKGKKWLSFHLAQKKVPPSLIIKATEIDSPDLLPIIKKKLKGDNSEVNIRKTASYLYKRGFSSEEIEMAIKKIKSD